MFAGRCVVISPLLILSAFVFAATDGATPRFLDDIGPSSGVDWMQSGADSSAVVHEITLNDTDTGQTLKQNVRWLPQIGLHHIVTRAEAGVDSAANVIDWRFQLRGLVDGNSYEALTYSGDTWYGSSFWTGPNWTRVGKDWQHSGEKSSSVRLFTCPSDGQVTISGIIFKADTKCGDGVRVSIRQNTETVWQQEIEAGDAQGVDPTLTLDVRKGDRLRFVVHRRAEIACDTTHWDPVISYVGGQVFKASDGFGKMAQGPWSYEMDMEQEKSLPRVYTFDRHFCFHQRSLDVGGEILLDADHDLPLFIIADGDDACGVAGAILGEGAWRFRAALDNSGLLAVSVSGAQGNALPELVGGPYKGNWMQAAAMLEDLRGSQEDTPNTRAFRAAIESAFGESVRKLDAKAEPELDMWAEIQWDWHRQDALKETAEDYARATAAVVEKAKALAADLGVSFPEAVPGQEPCAAYLRAHAARRAVALANPLMQFGEMLFCKRVPTSYSHLVMQYYGWRARPGGGLFVLENPGYSFAARDIGNGAFEKGSVLEPRLSYDAQRIVFSYVESAGREFDPAQLDNQTDEAFYHIWEMNADGTGLHQITEGPFDDLMPTYLPDGGIVFSSTRREGYARCFGGQFSPRWHVYTLHRVDPDGQNLRILSYHDTNEWFPAVSNSGTILYSRWDYIDRDAVTHQTLWGTRPDGTNPMAIWGNATDKPHCTFQIQPIPNSQKIVFTAAAHHSITAGPIVVVDPTVAANGQEALTRITPDYAFPEAETRDIPEYHESPWPLSEKYFLAGYSPWPLVWEPGANLPNALGIYLVDAFGNRELIYRDPVIGSSNGMPLAARTSPPVLSSMLPKDAAETGEATITDVYQGLGDVERGTIKSLRVVQIFPKTTPIGGAPPIGLAGEENARAILGEVPVEPDGSAYFTLPARKPVLFQLLDENGMAYQVMRSLTYVQPGEKISCVGCHESQKTTPLGTFPSASRRAPSQIQPGAFENQPFSYPLTVQPILEKHCVKCHSGAEPKGGKDLTGEPLNGFSRSYWSLCGGDDFAGLKTNPDTAAAALVPRFGMRNQVQMTPPGGAFGARGSKLIRMLREGHNDVKLEPGEIRNMAKWIDNNAIFYGVNLPEDQARQLRGEQVPMPLVE